MLFETINIPEKDEEIDAATSKFFPLKNIEFRSQVWSKTGSSIPPNGFLNVEYRNLSNGISAIHSGWKI